MESQTGSERSETKYGDMIDDHEWQDSTPDGSADDIEATSVSSHEIDVILTTDPDEKLGYGREKYTVKLTYDDDGTPSVLFAVKHRWKGNYWRDTLDLDWQDVPDPVQQQVAALLPVNGPEALNDGVRLFDEGGESRWEKLHKPRMEAMSGDEIWGTSFLQDALENAENAAEAFDDGSEGHDLAENIVSAIQDAITTVEDTE